MEIQIDGKIIPFKLGQKVWVWKNNPVSYTTEEFDGYDHLGPKSRIITHWKDNWGAYEMNFCFALLDKYSLNKIYLSKYECEKCSTRAW